MQNVKSAFAKFVNMVGKYSKQGMLTENMEKDYRAAQTFPKSEKTARPTKSIYPNNKDLVYPDLSYLYSKLRISPWKVATI